MRLEVPVPESLSNELTSFWTEVFGAPDEDLSPVLAGEELAHNADTIYLRRRGERLAGTCLLTVPKALPTLGGFGEVATDPEFRGTGIATELCGQSVEDFTAGGGQALFLGTGNPDAARVYHRLGWRKLAGANVMALIASGDSPEGFLVDLFREPAPAAVGAGSAADRVPMVPLILSPHDWQVMDANAGTLSTRHSLQGGCMSLYPRYTAVAKDGRGAWFSAKTADGRAVGLSTARLDGGGECQVDGFTHGDHQSAWQGLIESAAGWGAAHGAATSWAAVSVEDEDKMALFESLGFRRAGSATGFDLGGRVVGAVRVERG